MRRSLDGQAAVEDLSLIHIYVNEGETFLKRTVTGYETWNHHIGPDSKRQSMEWKHSDSPVKEKFKSQPSTDKVMLTFFWDSQEPMLQQQVEKGSTVKKYKLQ